MQFYSSKQYFTFRCRQTTVLVFVISIKTELLEEREGRTLWQVSATVPVSS
jgi:hypothetical protein